MPQLHAHCCSQPRRQRPAGARRQRTARASRARHSPAGRTEEQPGCTHVDGHARTSPATRVKASSTWLPSSADVSMNSRPSRWAARAWVGGQQRQAARRGVTCSAGCGAAGRPGAPGKRGRLGTLGAAHTSRPVEQGTTSNSQAPSTHAPTHPPMSWPSCTATSRWSRRSVCRRQNRRQVRQGVGEGAALRAPTDAPRTFPPPPPANPIACTVDAPAQARTLLPTSITTMSALACSRSSCPHQDGGGEREREGRSGWARAWGAGVQACRAAGAPQGSGSRRACAGRLRRLRPRSQRARSQRSMDSNVFRRVTS